MSKVTKGINRPQTQTAPEVAPPKNSETPKAPKAKKKIDGYTFTEFHTLFHHVATEHAESVNETEAGARLLSLDLLSELSKFHTDLHEWEIDGFANRYI